MVRVKTIQSTLCCAGACLSFLVALSFSSVAGAAEPSRVRPSQPIKSQFSYNFAQQHDSGVVFNLDIGLGYGALYSTYSKEGTKYEKPKRVVSGASLLFYAGTGYLFIPDVSFEVASFGILSTDDGVLAAGLATRYWFGDSGWSVSLVTGPSSFKVDSLDRSYFSNVSWALQFSIALSTWLSDHFHGSVKVVGGASSFNLYHASGLSAWWAGGALSIGFN